MGNPLMYEIKTNDGIFRGKTPDTIVRRIYGRYATIRHSADRNDPTYGLVVTPAYKNPGAYNVEAKIYWAEEI